MRQSEAFRASTGLLLNARRYLRSKTQYQIFAVSHLLAAHRAACEAREVEQANVSADHGPWFDHMMRLVPVSVVMAGAALEAGANELIQDIIDGSILSASKSRKLLLQDLKEDRSGNATEKYRQLALLFDKEPDIGNKYWNDAKLLVRFRNSFMHFKPAWDYEDIHDGALVRGLKTRIPIYRAYKDNFQFPYGFLTYDCAKWSVQSVLAFSAHFCALLGVKDRFSAAHLNFALS
jgi:hypothetical protein